MENLSYSEMVALNGGASAGSISISSSSDSLLSITFETSFGDHYRKTEISVGNQISLLLGLNAQRES